MSANPPAGGSQTQTGPPLFTQLDVVTTFAPPGQLGVRVGTVTGQINGSITINSTFDPTVQPPNFKANGQALIVDTNGDQILLDVAFSGTFIQPLTVPPPGAPPDIVKVGGSFTAVYTATSGTGKYSSITGQKFNGIGVAVLPAANPATGAAFSQFTGSLKGP
jgi:hypothetical protein